MRPRSPKKPGGQLIIEDQFGRIDRAKERACRLLHAKANRAHREVGEYTRSRLSRALQNRCAKAPCAYTCMCIYICVSRESTCGIITLRRENKRRGRRKALWNDKEREREKRPQRGYNSVAVDVVGFHSRARREPHYVQENFITNEGSSVEARFFLLLFLAQSNDIIGR